MRYNQYHTLVIDPPWPGPNQSPAFCRHNNLRLIPYSTMTGIQVASLRVQEVASAKAQLFLWATSRGLGDAFLLLQSWAFKFRGLFIWEKPLGLGRHVRSEAEFLLWGGRTGAPLVSPRDCPRQIHRWPQTPNHSEKPPEAYELIRGLSEHPRLDVFARQSRPGFEAWGNQTDLYTGQHNGRRTVHKKQNGQRVEG